MVEAIVSDAGSEVRGRSIYRPRCMVKRFPRKVSGIEQISLSEKCDDTVKFPETRSIGGNTVACNPRDPSSSQWMLHASERQKSAVGYGGCRLCLPQASIDEQHDRCGENFLSWLHDDSGIEVVGKCHREPAQLHNRMSSQSTAILWSMRPLKYRQGSIWCVRSRNGVFST